MSAYYGLGLGLGGAPVPIRGSHLAVGGLIDQFDGAAAAYSLRSLRSNTGNVVRVRRSSDNDEKDFTASQIESGEMVNWVTEESATADGFVETWYDQSGNGNHATQSVAGNQPKIVDGGSLVLDSNGYASKLYDGVNSAMDLPYVDFGSNDFYMVLVGERVDAGGSVYFLSMGQGGAGQEWSGLVDSGATDPSLSMGGFFDDDIARIDIDTNSGTKGVAFIASLVRDGDTGRSRLSGTEATGDISSLGSLTNPNEFGRIGCFFNGSTDIALANAKIGSVLIYDSKPDYAAIEASLANLYDITLS